MDLLVIIGVIAMIWGGIGLLVGAVLFWLGWFHRNGGAQ